MLTSDVIMLKNDVGLLTIAECLHILLGYLHELLIGEFLVRVRIERTMEYCLLRPTFLRYQSLHIVQYILHRVITIVVLIQFSGKQNARLPFLYLLEVIAECPSKVLCT